MARFDPVGVTQKRIRKARRTTFQRIKGVKKTTVKRIMKAKRGIRTDIGIPGNIFEV